MYGAVGSETGPLGPRRRGGLVSGLWCVVAGIVVSASGCATKGDLETLEQHLQSSVSKSSADTTAQTEALKREVKASLEEARRQLEEKEQKLSQQLRTQQDQLKAHQDELAKLSESLKQSQSLLTETRAKSDALQKETVELRSAARESVRTLHEFLKIEEARLKEGLKWVQSVLKEQGVEASREK